MAFTPEGISIDEAEAEVRKAWGHCYDEHAIATALRKIEGRPFSERAVMFFTRLAFRGIYFPMMRKRAWLEVLFRNRVTIFKLIREALAEKRSTPPSVPLPLEKVGK